MSASDVSIQFSTIDWIRNDSYNTNSDIIITAL